MTREAGRGDSTAPRRDRRIMRATESRFWSAATMICRSWARRKFLLPCPAPPAICTMGTRRRKTIAFRRRVPIVQMAGGAGHGKRNFRLAQLRQIIVAADQNRLSVARMIRRSRRGAVESPRPASLVIRRIRMVLPQEFLFPDLVKLFRQEFVVALMGLGHRRRMQRDRRRLTDRRHA